MNEMIYLCALYYLFVGLSIARHRKEMQQQYDRVRAVLQRWCLLPFFLQKHRTLSDLGPVRCLTPNRCSCDDCCERRRVERRQYRGNERLWTATACFLVLILPLLSLVLYVLPPSVLPVGHELATTIMRFGLFLLEVAWTLARCLLALAFVAAAVLFFCCCTVCGCATDEQRDEWF